MSQTGSRKAAEARSGAHEVPWPRAVSPLAHWRSKAGQVESRRFVDGFPLTTYCAVVDYCL